MATDTHNVTIDWVLQDGTSIDDCFYGAAVGPDGHFILAGYSYMGWDETSEETGRVVSKIHVNGTELWRYEDGNSRSSGVRAVVVDQNDGSVVFAGNGLGPEASSSGTHAGGEATFAVVKLDAGGKVVWEYQDGTEDAGCYPFGIAMAKDGSMVVVGYTYGDWDGDNAGDTDLAAFRLDANGTEIWRYQDGSENTDKLRAAAMVDEDTSVVVVGYTDDDEGDPDYVAIKLDASNGTQIWRYEDVSTASRYLSGMLATADGGIVLAGSAAGSAEPGSFGDADDYADFAALKLDSDGVELWRYQDGTLYPDWFSAVEVQQDGSFLLVGNTGGSWSGVNSEGSDGSTKDVVLMSLSADGEEIWRWQAGSGAEDIFHTIARGSDGRVLAAGCTAGSWEQPNSGGEDFVALMLKTSMTPTPAPSLAPTISASPAPIAAAFTPAPSPAPLASPAGTAAPNGSPAPSTAVSPAPLLNSPAPISTSVAPSPSPSSGKEKTPGSTLMIAGISSAVGGAIILALGAWRWRHRTITKRRASPQSHSPSGRDSEDQPDMPEHEELPAVRSHSHNSDGGTGDRSSQRIDGEARHVSALTRAERLHQESRGLRTTSSAHEPTLPLPLPPSTVPAAQAPTAGAKSRATSHGQATFSTEGNNNRARGVPEAKFVDERSTATVSTAPMSTVDRAEVEPLYRNQNIAKSAYIVDDSVPKDMDESEGSSSDRRRGSLDGLGLGQAVMAAAMDLAQNCHVPGVSEAATTLSILVKMVSDSGHSGSDAKLRQCRSIVRILDRAAEVTEKGGSTTDEAKEMLIDDVQFAISDLVELIKTYQSKNKLSKVLISTQFKRRQNELDAAVNQAIIRLQLGLHVKVSQDMSAVKDGMNAYQASTEEARQKSLAEARRSRRQRKLDAVEIPQDQVEVSDELLGRGGFGDVFIARVYERNAAAKVLRINDDSDQRGESDILGGRDNDRVRLARDVQKKAILRELEAMIRLRSPHTVNVYGAVTSLPDRLILVMELLVGGDLRALLKKSEDQLPEQQARQIIGDICAGMAFLHGKGTIHGDLKSANVLLDGAGRAKIGDFGTSRWTQHTKSTGFATYTKSPNTQMSLAWSAPEVLRATGCTNASDVYSFGIVAWEVLSRKLPWGNLPRPDDVFIYVVLNGLRPDIPTEAPADLADMMRVCWAGEPEFRPSFGAMLKALKSRG